MAINKRVIDSDGLLSTALEGLEEQKLRLDEQIRQIRGMLGRSTGRVSAASTTPAPTTARKATGKRKPLSSAARKRIAAAQKKRWAEYRKANAGEKG